VKIDTLKAVFCLVTVMKYFSYFLSSLSDLEKLKEIGFERNLFNDCGFCANQHSESLA